MHVGADAPADCSTRSAYRSTGPRAGAEALAIDWDLTDEGYVFRTELSNGALIHAHRPDRAQPAELTATLTKPLLIRLLFTRSHDGVQFSGHPAVLGRLLGYVDVTSNVFPMVTP